MIYVGSKRLLADKIIQIIFKNLQPTHTYIELFCGGCAVAESLSDKLNYNIVLNDINTALIAFYKKGQAGFIPQSQPQTKEEFLKNRKSSDPAIQGETIYLHSFRGTIHGYDPYQYKNKLTSYLNTINKLNKATFTNYDYLNYPLHEHNPKQTLIYNDIPYQGQRTDNYCKETQYFSHDQYWQWIREHKDYKIITSEYSAPSDFIPIKSIPFTAKIGTNNNTQYKQSVEHLFVYKESVHLWDIVKQNKFVV